MLWASPSYGASYGVDFSYDPHDEGFLPSDPEEISIQDFLSNDESRANSPAIPNFYNNYGQGSQNLQANMTLENTTAPESNVRDEMLLKQEDRVNSSLNEFNHISPSNIKKEETDEDNLTPKIYENQTPEKPTTKKLTTKKRTSENKTNTYIRKSREENPNHKGRRGKDSPYQGKHDDKSDDNGSKVIFTDCRNSIYNHCQEEVDSLFENKKIRISKKIKKIFVPTITKNSCLGLFSAPGRSQDPFSRSYGVSLPNSLTMNLSTPQYALHDYLCRFAVRVPGRYA